MQNQNELYNEIDSLKTKYNYLSIGDKRGLTGYIDFINVQELTMPVAYGRDIYNRSFVTICADMVYDDEDNKTIISTCTTIFKRYYETKSCIWASGSSYRKLFVTVGGINSAQLRFVCDLLRDGEVIFDKETYDDERMKSLRLCVYNDENRNPNRIVLALHDDEQMYGKCFPFCHTIPSINQKTTEKEEEEVQV